MDKLERAHSAARSAELKLKTATTLRSIGDNAPINQEYIIDAREQLERALALLNDYEIEQMEDAIDG